MPLTAKTARLTWRYDPVSGALWWRETGSGRVLDRPAGTIFYYHAYRYIKFRGKLYRAHRVIWLIVTSKWPACHIDHKNGNRDDNRWNNLRAANHQQNAQNRILSRKNASGYKGVDFKKDKNKWRATLTIARKQLHLGYFASKQEAYAAYSTAAEKHFGEFARV